LRRLAPNCLFSLPGLSPLSGAEDVRRLNDKHFSNRDFLPLLALLKEHSVPACIYFSLDLPGEDERSFARALALAERIAQHCPAWLLKTNMCHTLERDVSEATVKLGSVGLRPLAERGILEGLGGRDGLGL